MFTLRVTMLYNVDHHNNKVMRMAHNAAAKTTLGIRARCSRTRRLYSPGEDA